jgi:type IV pilus assembly protein PilW
MKNQKGFNLVEVLIGLTIGLIGLLAVSQVFVTFNKQRNTATQTMEAQNNGSMALYLMQHDIEMGGYGLMAIQDCANIQWYWKPVGCVGAGCGLQDPLLMSTAPVVITPGATATDSDAIRVSYAKVASAVPGSLLTEAQALYTDNFKLASVAGYAADDMVVLDVGGTCTLSQVTKVNDYAAPDPNKITVEHATTSAYNPAADPSNPAGSGWIPGKIDNLLANLGSYISKSYSVCSNTATCPAEPVDTLNTLRVGEFPSFSNSTLVDGIVFMKAQYGRDTTGDGAVDIWDTTVPADLRTIRAIRVGVVARSPLFEKEAVYAPTTFDVLPEVKDGGGTVIGAKVSYTVTGNDTHYRYRPYYTVIPLRNVIWAS